MTIELSDGTILPSYLGVRNPQKPRDTGTHTNIALRVGEVKEIVYPDEKRSQSGAVIEYVVDVVQQDQGGPAVTTRYFGVQVGNLFGGVADYTRYTLRKTDGNTKDDKLTNLGNGSKVMVLCVNGRTTSALIIGGAHDPNEPVESKDNGHNYAFTFNGVSWTINDDGELTITYKGATDIKGDPRDGVDTDNTGATMTFTKEGNWQVTEVPQNVVLKSGQGVLTGEATDHTILGDTYRQAESTMLNQLSAQLGSIAGSVTNLATAMGQAGVGVAPVAPSAATALGQAASVLVGLTSQFQAMQTAIQNFESNASQYLSTKNKSD